jgi:disulfide oxidoreductase YuzD
MVFSPSKCASCVGCPSARTDSALFANMLVKSAMLGSYSTSVSQLSCAVHTTQSSLASSLRKKAVHMPLVLLDLASLPAS